MHHQSIYVKTNVELKSRNFKIEKGDVVIRQILILSSRKTPSPHPNAKQLSSGVAKNVH